MDDLNQPKEPKKKKSKGKVKLQPMPEEYTETKIDNNLNSNMNNDDDWGNLPPIGGGKSQNQDIFTTIKTAVKSSGATLHDNNKDKNKKDEFEIDSFDDEFGL